MSIHLIVAPDRYRCGKRPTPLSGHSTIFQDVTCQTCIESHKFENGIIREYRLGGSYQKGKVERKMSNHWDYKKDFKKLESKLSLAMQIIEKLEESNKIISNQMEGVATAFIVHGLNLNRDFFIENCSANANEARQTIKEVEELKKGLK